MSAGAGHDERSRRARRCLPVFAVALFALAATASADVDLSEGPSVRLEGEADGDSAGTDPTPAKAHFEIKKPQHRHH